MTRPSSTPSPEHNSQLDLQIDCALHALRTVEPPSLLTDRVLEALHHREAASPSHARRIGTVMLLWPSVTVAALVLVAVIVTLRTHHATDKTSVAVVVRPSPPAQTSPISLTATHSVHGPISATLSSFRTAGRPASPSVRAHLTAQAEAEIDPAFLPSFPAPPMPLTQQERFLRTLTRRGSEEQTAQLDPAIRSAELAEDAAEYFAFFAPPPLLPDVQLQLAHLQLPGVPQ